MSAEKSLSLEQRIDVLEAKMRTITAGLNAILIEFREMYGFGEAQKEGQWDPTKVNWSKAQGTKGPYERADPQSSLDFEEMLDDIKQHGGKLTRDGYFMWVFSDACTVGRKRKR